MSGPVRSSSFLITYDLADASAKSGPNPWSSVPFFSKKKIRPGRLKWGGHFAPSQFAVVTFAVGNFAEPSGFCVVPPARVHNVYRWCARNSRRTPNVGWEISPSI